MILLTALGVDDATIRADYLRTNEATAGVQESIIGRCGRRRPDLDVDAIRPVLEVRAEYLDAAYAEVQRAYGTFDRYLPTGSGWTARSSRGCATTCWRAAQPVTIRA